LAPLAALGREPEEYGVFLEFDGPRAALEAAGLRVGTHVGRTFTARLSREDIPRLWTIQGLKSARLARYVEPLLNVSAFDIRADVEHTAVGIPPVYQGRAGQGVLVALIDSGIDFGRPDFKDGAGRTRILAIWDQTDPFGPHPSTFGYGTEISRSQIDGDPGSIRQADVDGHGTLVAGILAGSGVATGCNQPDYRYVGIAPLAEIIAIKTDYSETGIVDGVRYAFERAAALGKDCVVNISLGSHFGPHDGSDPMSAAISALTGPGRLVVAAAGNDRENHMHGRLTTTSTTPGTDHFTIHVPSYTPNGGRFNDYLFVGGWYDPSVSVSVRVRGPHPADTMSVPRGGARALATPRGKIVLVNQATALGFGGTPRARQFELQVYDSLSGSPPAAGDWEIDVVADGPANLGARVDAWIFGSRFGGFGSARVTNGYDPTTVVSEPACGDSVLAVAAHCTRTSWISCAQGSTCLYFNQVLNDIAHFSSPGPRRDGVLKPEISAPGLGVASIHAATAPGIPDCYDADDGVHEITLGTSFSSPHAAAAVALLLQSSPGASPSRARLMLTGAARTDALTGVVPNPDWGYGKLDVYAALSHTAPVVAVASPSGGESWPPSSTQTVSWSAYGAVTTVDLDYSLDDRAGPWVPIQHGATPTGSTSWSVPASPSDSVIVRLQSNGTPATFYSGRFRIGSPSSGGPAFALGFAVPNPANGPVDVAYTLPGASHVSAVIVSVDGRRVWRRSIVAPSGGSYTVRWDGHDDNGIPMPPGLYFLQVITDYGTRSQRIVRVR